jgi:hypothetical protein
MAREIGIAGADGLGTMGSRMAEVPARHGGLGAFALQADAICA